MKTAKISESGFIGGDGRMRLPMDRINAYCAEHKGERLVAIFIAAVPGSTQAQQTYYYKYVLPTIREAFRQQGERKTEKAVDNFLMEQYPGDKSESEIGLGEDVMEARYLNQSQMSDFLEWLQQYAAENFAVYVDDPKTI